MPGKVNCQLGKLAAEHLSEEIFCESEKKYKLSEETFCESEKKYKLGNLKTTAVDLV